ncbi:hypothetical protein CTAYLR_010705 [Chrysophaeum taylorii]|uniref:FYVE-type domain-containing protein n=1 Tax=Chrysophaeum taylorii TaxID=2483200 RepID=A0AAD7UH91_9STRA|nr:hypothetical protein CTAYLR_010705 [Chrysophaeum taylorii]
MDQFEALVARAAANGCCFDCGRSCHDHPWMSVQHAIVLCIQCAGVHRAFGVDVSFVRSIKLDTLTVKESALLECGGNPEFAAFLDERGEGVAAFLDTTVEHRYFSSIADLYRRRLAAKLVGGDLPNDLRPLSPRAAPPKRAPLSTIEWKPRLRAKRCEVCLKRFNIVRRRHHCRRCGRCVCEPCSPRECYRPLPPVVKPSRHCVSCVAKPSREN